MKLRNGIKGMIAALLILLGTGVAAGALCDDSAAAANATWYWPTPASSPIAYPDGSWLSSSFGWRELKHSMHNGIDIRRVSESTPVYAARAGMLYPKRTTCTHNYPKPAPNYTDPCSSAGNWLIIDHQDGTYSAYMHLTKLSNTKQRYVEQGELIGYCGTTGSSTGVHLHFEVRTGRANDVSGWYDYTPTDPQKLTYTYGASPIATPQPTSTPKPTTAPAPTVVPASESYRVTASGGLSLRKSADATSARLCVIPKGAVIGVTGRTSAGGREWGRTTYNGNTGWCALEYATLISAQYEVTASALNVRTGPGTNYSRAGTLLKGARVTVTVSQSVAGEEWLHVERETLSGWCMAKYLRKL